MFYKCLPKATTWMLWGTKVDLFGFVNGSGFCPITWRWYCFCFSSLLRTALNDCIQATPHFAASFTALSCWLFKRAVLYKSQVSQDLGFSVRNFCGMCSTRKTILGICSDKVKVVYFITSYTPSCISKEDHPLLHSPVLWPLRSSYQ